MDWTVVATGPDGRAVRVRVSAADARSAAVASGYGPARIRRVRRAFDPRALLGDLAADGKSILLISSELPELLGVTDRLLVMRRGRIVGDLVTAETTQEEVMQLAAVGREEDRA